MEKGYHAFHPGKVWLDTDGNRIHAHGGSVLYWEGVYYWYGENKEFTNGENGIWHNGVNMYASEDLYNWRFVGNIIPAQPEDPDSPLHPAAKMDRPHIIYNEKTKKFVCWVKVMCKDGKQRSTVLSADNLTGPYRTQRTNLLPCGFSAGDFDLAVGDDGRAYYYFEKVHTETICADLTEDYLDVTGHFSRHFLHPEGVPYVREATAHFLRKGKHYLLTSGTTGYFPNPSEVAIGDDWHGPFTVLGDPHPADTTATSFHSQISSVFRVEGKKDLFIAVADRWLPERTDLSYSDYGPLYARAYAPDGNEEEKLQAKGQIRKLAGFQNTAIADYVWLPLRFDGEQVIIDWYDTWSLEDYE